MGNLKKHLYILSAFLLGGNGLFAGEATSAATNRIVIVEDKRAVHAFKPNAEVVEKMVAKAMIQITGEQTVSNAWRSMVKEKDVVGLKVYSAPGPDSGTRPAVVAAVVSQLLNAGIRPENIIVWDRRLSDLRRAGYGALQTQYKIRLAGAVDEGFDPSTFYENSILGNLVSGDLEFGSKGEGVGRKSYVSKLVSTTLTKIINIPSLLNHNEAGITGNLYSLAFGSIDNLIRFESPAERMSSAIPEIYALQAVGDKVILNIMDSLVCQYQGEQLALLHYATQLNQIWVGHDPVAIDNFGLQELNRQRIVTKTPNVKFNTDIYSNAALLELGSTDLKNLRVDFFSN
ncbi:MAG: hypothetical protein JWN25_1679 [Verrucomicrobiales bacterium]|nr:hypothetical protein [Verrucomicrobiales bacterium]MDB6131273.1 hypothetical protein [Verrucomicrobiales bacterium]